MPKQTNKRFNDEGKLVGWQLDGPIHLDAVYREQVYYRSYVAVCRKLGYPVLWPNPLQVREQAELAGKRNGGRKPRATKAEMLARPEREKRFRRTKAMLAPWERK